MLGSFAIFSNDPFFQKEEGDKKEVRPQGIQTIYKGSVIQVFGHFASLIGFQGDRS